MHTPGKEYGASIACFCPKVKDLCVLLQQAVLSQTLGNLGDGRAIAPMTACLKDAHGDVRRAAAAALQRLPVS
jgi:HEAT repeat protein